MEENYNDISSLIKQSDELTESYHLMQKKCSHQLSKISLFVIKIGDIRVLCDNGYKWIRKESGSRETEIRSYYDGNNETSDDIMAHNTVMETIEKRVTNILRQRMVWIKRFIAKVEAGFAQLEDYYNEISDLAIEELENEDHQLARQYREFYAEKRLYRKILPVQDSSVSSSSSSYHQVKKKITRNSGG
jgi:hypothetical protein